MEFRKMVTKQVHIIILLLLSVGNIKSLNIMMLAVLFSWIFSIRLRRFICLSLSLFFFFVCARFFVAAWAFLSSCLEWGLLSSSGAWASHWVGYSCEHKLKGTWASAVATYGLSSCSSPALEHRQLWCKGLDAPRHVGSPQIRGPTHVSFIGSQILNRWSTT